MDSTKLFLISNDTIFMIVQGTNATGGTNVNAVFDIKLLTTLFISIIGAIIGASVTIWHKRKEFALSQENLKLQKENFNLTKSKTESELKAEIEKLENLSNQYKLSLKRFDYEQVEKILELGSDKDEKILMIKDFNSMLKKYRPEIPLDLEDYDEYREYVAEHIYSILGEIKKDIDDLLNKHVATFSSLHGQFRKVASEANALEREIHQLRSDDTYPEHEFIVTKFTSRLLDLYRQLTSLLESMRSEFAELDRMHREFILDQSQKRT